MKNLFKILFIHYLVTPFAIACMNHGQSERNQALMDAQAQAALIRAQLNQTIVPAHEIPLGISPNIRASISAHNVGISYLHLTKNQNK